MLNKEELKKVLKEKNIKSLDEFNNFMRAISKDVLESLLDGEITDFLGYEKYDQEAKETDNSRNGHTTKGVQSKFGEIELEVPRDFEPVVVKSGNETSRGLKRRSSRCMRRG
jgi:transposase-like protein